MTFALCVFAAVAVCEMTVWLPPLWKWHQWTARVWLILTGLSTLWLFVAEPTFMVGLLSSVAVYRAVNLARTSLSRMREEYLHGVSWRTAWTLLVYQAIIFAGWWTFRVSTIGQGGFWYLILMLQLAVSIVLLTTTLRHLRTTRPPREIQPLPDAKLPSITVAIPARNETEQLERCLSALIASDYPKLEIIVLDDCSQNPKTPEIIRSYAHDGVRFVLGETASDGWLAKTQAYERLMEEASGELILFCGVDAQFEPQSLRRLVLTMLQKNKSMISVMPRNILHGLFNAPEMLVQPMRYAWEFALPRKMFRRPPVLSTCWIVQRKLLTSAGGFKAVSRSIVPESYFARVAVVHDGYSFMQSDGAMGITCDKDVTEQHDTATRMKYPQLHRRPELVVLLTLGELLALILPIVFLTASFAVPGLTLLAGLSGLTSAILIVWYCAVVSLVYRQFTPLSVVALPFAVIHDVAVLNYSMLKYEFSAVLWKGRNVCVPIMRVEPQLPKLP